MPEPANENSTPEITINEKNLEVLVAKFIPTSQYFERSFTMMQGQISDLKHDMNRRFEQVQGQITDLKQSQADLKHDMNLRFEQVVESQRVFKADIDKRFEQVDKRFEQVDRQFERVNTKLDAILDRVDRKIDEGLREGRGLTIRLFSFAMVFSAISMAGLLGKILGLF